MTHLPVLLLGYSRPKKLESLLNQLKLVTKGRIYISIDSSPQNSREIETRVNQSRDIATLFAETYPEVKLRFPVQHEGCYMGVKAAIDWFFQHEESGMILEDDLVISNDIFEYALQMNNLFRENKLVGSVSLYRARSYRDEGTKEGKLLLSPYPTSWGWMTWRDRWVEMLTELPIGVKSIPLRKKFLERGGLSGYRRWSTTMTKLKSQQLDSWAYRWLFTHWLMNWKTVVSPINLIKNDGFGLDATHTKLGISHYIQTSKLADIRDWEMVPISFKTEKDILQEVYGVQTTRQFLTRKLLKK